MLVRVHPHGICDGGHWQAEARPSHQMTEEGSQGGVVLPPFVSRNAEIRSWHLKNLNLVPRTLGNKREHCRASALISISGLFGQ